MSGGQGFDGITTTTNYNHGHNHNGNHNYMHSHNHIHNHHNHAFNIQQLLVRKEGYLPLLLGFPKWFIKFPTCGRNHLCLEP